MTWLEVYPLKGGDLKSNVSDYLEVAQSVYIDSCAKCIADVSDLRDLETLRSRVKQEGMSFLTLTLPRFCGDFESALERGQIDPTLFQGFRKSGSIPAFLQGMIGLLFNRETGRIYDEKDKCFSSEASVLVGSVRQICLTFKKIELPCSPVRVNKSLENFIAIEQANQLFSVPTEASDEFRSVAFVLWSRMLRALRPDMLVPRHGPGATAERISGNQKYVWRYWYERLEPYFPFFDNAYNLGAFDSREFQEVTFVKPDQELPVKVITVPKTLKGPRIIAIEPVCMQYTQQAVQRALYELIESSELTKGHVNFTDQSINQKLALMSSNDGRYATIDLSDASDRVLRDLALDMFNSNLDIRDSIDACRSTKAKLPDGTVVSPLAKFASMGSALCFPVESMYFYTICVAALLREHNLPVSYENCFNVSRNVYVYGDDIVVPSTNATTILEYLQKYNCKVNASKTFVSGSFRESCGVDAYDGEEVTPTYVRKERPKNRRQASELCSWVAARNSFYSKGYWRTAHLLDTVLEKVIGPLPYVSEQSSVLGRISYMGYRSAERWNEKYQSLEVRGWTPVPIYSSDSVDGYPALQKSILRLEGQCPSESGTAPLFTAVGGLAFGSGPVDDRNLERTARHGAVALKRRWSSAQ